MKDEGMGSAPLTKQDFEALARFRFGIRRYLRFSEEAVRRHGLTPQHYQLLLALKGFPGREWATMKELADRLRLRHHSVVELVDRAQQQGLVQRAPHPPDARAVRVELTANGQQVLARLSELQRMGAALALPIWDDTSDNGDAAAP
jgi:DNA-binding MarR family transcriptional regulator